MLLNVHGFDVPEVSESASCGPVDDAIWRDHFGVVVPIPMRRAELRYTPKVSAVDVENLEKFPPPEPVASVPQLNTPAGEALTSQLAVFKFETMSPVVEAIPVFETWNSVVVADAVDEAIAKRVVLGEISVGFAWMVRRAYGDVVPIPTRTLSCPSPPSAKELLAETIEPAPIDVVVDKLSERVGSMPAKAPI
jgi:hypothetical protein